MYTTFLAVKKLENGLLKFYLIHALTNNRLDKVNEFLTKMTNDLQTQNEWKDWFSKTLPVLISTTKVILCLI